MFKSKNRSNPALTSISFLLGLCLLMVFTKVTSGEVVNDPMKPPPFALNKFRLAKLKQNGKALAVKPAVKKTPAKPLVLSSILIGKYRKVAIVNDQMLVVGERIGKHKVVAILKDRIRMFVNGKTVELKLDNELTAIRKNAVESKL